MISWMCGCRGVVKQCFVVHVSRTFSTFNTFYKRTHRHSHALRAVQQKFSHDGACTDIVNNLRFIAAFFFFDLCVDVSGSVRVNVCARIILHRFRRRSAGESCACVHCIGAI